MTDTLQKPNRPYAREGMDRRSFLALAGAGALSACGQGRSAATASTEFTIYSPAPASTPLDALNRQILSAAQTVPGLTIEMPAVALPASIETINAIAPAQRPNHLPIMTTIDWALAAEGKGPDWHGYDRAHTDMRMVSTLYDVGFGFQLFGIENPTPDDLRGKRIGVPPRPSAVRLLSELTLRDGLGMADDVELVGMAPGDTLAAASEGRIDGTSWNLVLPGQDGPAPMLAAMPLPPGAYVPFTSDIMARINEANGLPLKMKAMPQGPLLNFAQGLAAWENTPSEPLRQLSEAILAVGGQYAGLPTDPGTAFSWPIEGETRYHAALTDSL